jgi:hypothetical protein
VGGGATVTLAAGGSRSIKTAAVAVDLASGAKLDLNDNRLIVDYTAGASPVAALHTLLASAYNYGAWDGPGITSSTAGAAGPGLFTLGCGEASGVFGLVGSETAAWGGQTIDGTSVLVRYTYAGDANLDGTIDGGDYGVIDNNIQIAGAHGYWNGDFNYDGVVDGGDYGIIDNNIQAQGAPLPASDLIAPEPFVTAVPEPAAGLVVTFLASTSLFARGRRRQRRTAV